MKNISEKEKDFHFKILKVQDNCLENCLISSKIWNKTSSLQTGIKSYERKAEVQGK